MRLLLIASSLFFLATAAVAQAQTQQSAEPGPAATEASSPSMPTSGAPQGVQLQIQDLQNRISLLESRTESSQGPAEEDLTRLRLDLLVPDTLDKSFTGLSPGASKVYYSKFPLSVGGYGEVHYTSESDGSRSTNVARVNPYIGYRLSKTLVVNTSFTFQNGGAVEANNGRGAAQVEFAYIDFLLAENAGIRAGHVLLPFGILNTRFEPTQFPMVNRMRAEQTIVPTSWHENGILGFGRIGSVEIQGGIVNSGDASKFTGPTWIGGGRQNGVNAKAERPAWVLRAEVVDKISDGHSRLGFSTYYGNQSQNDPGLGLAEVLLGAIHGEISSGRFEAMAMWSEGSLSDADLVSARQGEVVGNRVRGGYLILAYDLLPRLAPFGLKFVPDSPPPAWRQLPFFVSYEYEDLHAEVPAGLEKNPAFRTDVFTVGFNFKPHPQVVVKADFAKQINAAGGDARVVETAIGFVF